MQSARLARDCELSRAVSDSLVIHAQTAWRRAGSGRCSELDARGMADSASATALRRELKSFEAAFRAEHGRDPAKVDIKARPHIGPMRLQ